MMIGELKLGASLLQSLPEDIFAVISRLISPSDLCNVSLCCKSLCDLVGSDKIWLVQCELVKALPLSEVSKWRIGVSSYKALCRFLVEAMKPLVGVWVHEYPELGNVVYVMPGFLSVVGCRIIPQEVGPMGIQEGRVLWSPVFEIICGFDGSPEFFLHGRDGRGGCLYPGFVTGIEKSCKVLLLEVGPRGEKKLRRRGEKKLRRWGKGWKKLLLGEKLEDVPFYKLAFSDRKNLLDLVTSHVGVHVAEPLIGMLFPTPKVDEAVLLERRTILLKMRKFGGNWENVNLEEEEAQLSFNPMLVDAKNLLENQDELSDRRNFLDSSDRFGLTLKASNSDARSCYKGWPFISKDCFALYKIPVKDSIDNEEYAGLWGGTFGWPPGRSSEDRPGKAFYLLMLTYDNSLEDSDGRLLIGTKILEGARSAQRPNGTAMFVVDIDSPSHEPFPFDADGRNFEYSYTGKGISDGYGFRYPGSVPGSLYVISSDHLAFVWQETRKVVTLQRLNNLEEMLKNGLGLSVPPLPPTMNFTYLERSYRNVYTEPSPSYSSD